MSNLLQLNTSEYFAKEKKNGTKGENAVVKILDCVQKYLSGSFPKQFNKYVNEDQTILNMQPGSVFTNHC